MKNKFRGFTLVELLLVVTILGILAAIAMPKLFPQTEKARVAEAIAILQSIRQGEAAYFLERDQYCSIPGDPCTWEDLGMENPNLNPKYFTYSVDAQGNIYQARALRLSVSDPGGNYGGKTIAIDQNGVFGCSPEYRFCPT